MKQKFTKYLFFAFIIVFLCANDFNLIAQSVVDKSENDKYNFSVVWQKKISSIDDLKPNNNLINSVKEFLFGKANVVLQKPVNLVSLDSNLIIILDQGLKFPIFIKQNKSIEYNNEKLAYPSLLGICKWGKNKILFTDSKLNKIFSLSADDDNPEILFDSLKLNQPTGIGYSTVTHEIWVVETGNHRIKILDEKGDLKKTIGERGNKKGQFNFPTHLWIDEQGNVYIVDALNFRIQVFNKNADFLTMFGETGDSPGYFSSIKGISTDSYGHIYIVDALFNVVQVFDKEGTFLYNFGGFGKGDGEFYMPTGIFIDSENNIYVADTYNSRIQIFKLIKGMNK